ncbi:hypothetical protein [endosymbiont GvMRE of Glomus versiforme]|uniref:hypothetical protein n=1 Tax=endosymbiont GvMRE of Glomus versiforme TaxID=2039283 RepID=UPI000ECFC45B|nr:hypothetical protein [endosymbiont GvMRE of Glomus versiforme]RHZ35386.1 hypothetical protein GvMRE_IIg225 [endosymbiont GvMRE of Glomus versiforme]
MNNDQKITEQEKEIKNLQSKLKLAKKWLEEEKIKNKIIEWEIKKIVDEQKWEKILNKAEEAVYVNDPEKLEFLIQTKKEELEKLIVENSEETNYLLKNLLKKHWKVNIQNISSDSKIFVKIEEIKEILTKKLGKEEIEEILSKQTEIIRFEEQLADLERKELKVWN